MAGTFYLERESEIARYREALEHLRACALSPANSVKCIQELRKALEELSQGVSGVSPYIGGKSPCPTLNVRQIHHGGLLLRAALETASKWLGVATSSWSPTPSILAVLFSLTRYQNSTHFSTAPKGENSTTFLLLSSRILAGFRTRTSERAASL